MYGPRFSSDAYVPDGTRVLRTTDFTEHGAINFATPPRLALNAQEIARYRLKPNDLLVTRTGSLGTLAIFPGGVEAIAGAFLIYYRLPIPELTIRYIFYLLKSPLGQSRLRDGGAGVGRPNLNMPRIDGIPIPLPPLAEQTRIVAEVERRLSVVEELEGVVSANLQRAVRLRQSILQKAFTGEL